MAAVNSPGAGGQDAGTAWFFLFLGGLLGASLLYARLAPDLADALLSLARALLIPLSLVSDHYGQVLDRLAAQDPGTKEPAFAWAVLGAVCRPYLAAALPLVLLLTALGMRASVRDACHRTLDMRALLQTAQKSAERQAALGLATSSACVAPALNWPRSLLDEPMDKGPWRAARQPLQLAADHDLLLRQTPAGPKPVDRAEILGPDNLACTTSPWLGLRQRGLCLDRERTRRLLAGQLQQPWKGFAALPPHLAKLACAFVFFACGEKDRAQILLDSLSLSFRAPCEGRPWGVQRHFPFLVPGRAANPYRMDTSLSSEDRALFARLQQEPLVTGAIRPHSVWRDLALLALYEAARSKGVLPTAQFLWLRPVGRPLYYLCNNVGRRTAWPEISGAWAHYMAEKRLAQLEPESHGLKHPQVEEAINALEVALYEEGWISQDMLSPAVAANKMELGLD